ncbi:MAG: PQQ-binding-like beta-propeller repeat protein [Myxococcales bacterium]|nr:PQQ-binding-like beta-propeller repeat protein [Myxococcales bacterium]
MRRAVLTIATLSALSGAACAATLTGKVYVDTNGDHERQPDEPGVAGAVVALERGVFTTTDADGSYRLDVAAATGFVWVRVPDGFRPGPVWRAADGPDLDLPLIPLTAAEAAAPLTFVVAADSHTNTIAATDPWDGGDLADAIDQAISLPTPPRFFTIVGDITQGNAPDQFERVQAALAGVTVPWVPVAGNHDWYDGGGTYRRYFGPDNYSFDVGNLHVVVWDANLSEPTQVAFFAADLALVDPAMIVIGLGHGSPKDEVADQLAALGVDYLFTGHWHANRKVERTGLVEWGTQTLVMGGIDSSPAGYRVVTFEGDTPTVVHRERLIEPHLGLVAPSPGSCAPADGFELLAAAALDASVAEVTASIDCGPTLTLTPVGGWTYRATVGALAPGTHALALTATTPAGRTVDKQVRFDVCAPADPTPIVGAWPQLGGGPTHLGRQQQAIAPPVVARWTTAVGGSIALGSPVVADGTVVVSVADRASGERGGLVALDLVTGAVRWRYQTPYPPSNAPAIADGTVVVGLGNGEVHAVALADGAPRWTFDVAEGLPMLESALWAAPTISDGTVYVAVQGKLAAIELATGAELWNRDRAPGYPWLGTLAAIAVADDTALVAFNRDDGLTGWRATTGAPLWANTGGATVAINATPVIDGATVYMVNARGEASAAELATGQVLWTTSTTDGGFDWGYSVTAAPAVADGKVFVPTQWDDLVALDATTGAVLWRYATPPGPLNFAHYRSSQAGFVASPVVTGDRVWLGRPDGALVALDAADGRERFSVDLGAPIASAIAAAGGYLVVATYDGSVHALASGAAAVPTTLAPCEAPLPSEAGGCCSTGDRDGPVSAGAGLLVVAALLRRRRRR